METVLLTILLILALALIGIVLLQRSEGGGLGMGGGGGGGGVMSARGAATALAKVTWILGIAFFATALALTVLSAKKNAATSVVDGIAPATNAPALPGNLTLPAGTDFSQDPDGGAAAPSAPAPDVDALMPPAADPVTPPPAD